MSTVELRGLSKSFDGTAAVEALDLAVGEGEFLTLLGPSGCGKTTTLRCVAGLESPDQGEIRFGGTAVVDCARRLDVPAHRRDVGMVFQSYALWPHMSVLRNVAYPLRVKGASRGEAKARAEATLELVGLAGFGQRAPSALSGGQQQRVALARALVRSPSVLLLDEPLSNLDATLRTQMRQELRRIHGETGTTTIYVTHDQLEAAALSGRIVVMRDGRAVQVGTPDEVFRRPATPWVARFVGFENVFAGEVERVVGDEAIVRPPDWPSGIVCPSRPGIAGGQRVQLAVRSTAIVLGASEHARNSFEARVVDSAYLGNLTEYRLEAHGIPLTASVPTAASNGAAPSVAVSIDPAAIAIVADEA